MKKTAGLTLIEALLVLVLVSSILYLSLLQYLAIRNSVDAENIRDKTKLIFAAMTTYYQKNCYGNAVNNKWGSLNPNNASHPLDKDNFPINISNDLQLDAPDYVAQFNLQRSTRYICVRAIDSSKAVTGNFPTQNCLQTKEVGTIVSWQPQVAYKLNKDENKDEALKVLRGTCLSTVNENYVVPCDQASGGDYVVWESDTTSNVLANTFVLKQFAQRYRQYANEYLIGNDAQNNPQYFVCAD